MKLFVLLATAASIAALSGCSTPATRFYTLTPPGSSGAGAAIAASAASPIYIEFAPMGVPERLSRPQMIVRKAGDPSNAKVEVLDQYRWTSSFEAELRDALNNRITRQVNGINSSMSGRPASQPAWRVAVQLLQFDAVENTSVEIELTWTVRRTGSDATSSCRWASREAVAPGMDAIAQGAQRLVQSAGDAVALHVSALQAGQSGGCKA